MGQDEDSLDELLAELDDGDSDSVEVLKERVFAWIFDSLKKAAGNDQGSVGEFVNEDDEHEVGSFSGIEGVKVSLYKDDEKVETTLTDEDGEYSFKIEDNGEYVVSVEQGDGSNQVPFFVDEDNVVQVYSFFGKFLEESELEAVVGIENNSMSGVDFGFYQTNVEGSVDND